MSEETGKFVAEIDKSRTRTAKAMKKIAVSCMGMNPFGSSAFDTISGFGTNTYSPYFSADYFELPLSRHERIRRERFWYKTNPYIRRSIDNHTELPLSKIRLSKPKVPDGAVKEKKEGQYKELVGRSHRFFTKMADRINLFDALIDISFEFNLHDEVWVFAEDAGRQLADTEFDHDMIPTIDGNGIPSVRVKLTKKGREDKERTSQQSYRGWNRLIVLPPEYVEEKSFPFSSRRSVYLHPDGSTKKLVQNAFMNPEDPVLQLQVEDVPDEVLKYLAEGRPIPLGTDPDKGSFVFQIYRRKHAYQNDVIPRMDCLERTLTHRDKLRQAQASIASRAMTPKRLVWAEDLDQNDVNDLRAQIDMSLVDPDFTIIANYEIHWEELGARDRLLDLDREDERLLREIYAGTGTNESMMTGEGSYGGDRFNLEVINTVYLLFRERLQNYVEKMLFAPVARRKGFVITDEDGDEIPIYPKLSFTRLAIRDNQETFDSFLNLYQKGSLPVRFILELLNIDADAAMEELERDVTTLNDSTFNEALRSAYSDVGRAISEKTNLIDVIASRMGLSVRKEQEEGRYGTKFGSSDQKAVVAQLLSEAKEALHVLSAVLVQLAGNGKEEVQEEST